MAPRRSYAARRRGDGGLLAGAATGLEHWTAAVAALVFALHQFNIEPVTWVSAASDTMVTMFFALAFGAFSRT